MSTSDTGPDAVRGTRSRKRWLIPGTAVVIGLAYLAAGLAGGDHAFAFGGLALMLATGAAVLALGRKSETIAGLLDRKDERINKLDGDATVFAGMTLIAAVLAAFVIEVAQGEDGQPYATLGAIAGVAYVLALGILRVRR